MADLSLQIDQQRVQAGSILSGNLHLHVRRKTIRATELDVYFCGNQYTSVTADKSTVHDKIRLVHHRNILQGETPAKGIFPPGTYTVPFRVRLPKDLPSTLWIDKWDGSVKIEYCVQAVLRRSGTFWDYRAKQTVSVQERPKPHKAAVPFASRPFVRNMRFNFLWFWRKNQGIIATSVDLSEGTELVRGQPVKVNLTIRNDSRALIKRIRCKVLEAVRWQARSHKASYGATLARQTVRMQPVLPDDSHRQTKDVQLPIKLVLPAIPKHAKTTYRNIRLSISHQLIVDVTTEPGYNNLHFVIPVSISRRPLTPRGY